MQIRRSWTQALGLATISLMPFVAQADTSLPAPYVSRALDAVLMPVDDTVRATFGLGAGETGLLVIALDPEGTAAALGLQPGSVIGTVGDTPLVAPIELDQIVYYWLSQGVEEIQFGVWQLGALAALPARITETMYFEQIEVTTVSTWTAWEVSSFSYESYYSEYSEEITASYEESETLIEEAVSNESFEAEMAVEDEAMAEEGAVDEAVEADCSLDDSCADEGIEEEADVGGDEGVDEGGDEGGYEGGDEGGGDEVVEE